MNQSTIERNRCPITEDELDRLGIYFTYHQFNQIGITFENFVQRVRNDTWKLMFTT